MIIHVFLIDVLFWAMIMTPLNFTLIISDENKVLSISCVRSSSLATSNFKAMVAFDLAITKNRTITEYTTGFV